MSIFDALNKVIKFVKNILEVRCLEHGVVSVDWTQTDQMIFVPVENDRFEVVKVWTSFVSINNPYGGSFEIMPERQSFDFRMSYISEIIPMPGGFQFKVNLVPGSSAEIAWVALEKEYPEL